MSHTAGPWTVEQPDEFAEFMPSWEIATPTGTIACLLGDEDDARLIAAAPELLAAIRTADTALGRITQDAINRLVDDSPTLLIDVRKLDDVVVGLHVAIAKATGTDVTS